MKWRGAQLERATFIAGYSGLMFVILRVITLVVLVFSLFTVVLAFFGVASPTLLGWALVLLGPTLLIGSFHLYVSYLASHPEFMLTNSLRSKETANNFDHFAVRAVASLTRRGVEGFTAQLFSFQPLSAVFYRLGLTEKDLAGLLLSKTEPLITAESLATSAMQEAGEGGLVTEFDLARVLINQPAVKEYLNQRKLSETSIMSLIEYYESRYRLTLNSRFWLPGNEQREGGFAKLWSVSYTNLLDRFTSEITPDVHLRVRFFPFYREGNLVERLVTELNKSHGQNVLLIGEQGIGKRELFYTFASRLLNSETKSPLDGLQVRILNLQALLAAAPNAETLAPLFQAVFTEVTRAGNVVLFVPGLGNFLREDGAGSTDATNLLNEYLSDSRVRIVATVLPEEYVTLVKSSGQLSSHFSAIEVPPPTGADLEKILLLNLLPLERRYGVFFPLSALNTVVELAARYVKDLVSPKREIDLLEEIAAFLHSHDETVVSSEDVATVVEQRVKVPIRVDEDDQQTLLNLEATLHRRIVGQERAVKLVSDALMRSRAGLSQGNKPIGSFLFLGPTGVGKTETAKALAEIYFGSTQSLSRLDMTEFADSNGLQKLLGTDPVGSPGALTVAIQQRPSSVVLLDEIEKASPAVRNVFLQLLDEGRLTTNFGKVLDFTNTIVIATSNAGSDFIKTQVERRAAPATLEKQLIDRLIAERVYPPEFLNRFDGVVVYLPLSLSEIKQVVRLQLEALRALLQRQKGVTLEVTPNVVDELARRGYDPVFGARALQRVVKGELETAIAREILQSKATAGSKIQISSL